MLHTLTALAGLGAGATATAAQAAALDSAAAVRAAKVAMAGGRYRQSDFRVLAFTRDSAGAVVSLGFMCPPPHACVGGGGRVRVRPSGRAVVLEPYR
jgi:hypothetical protein